MNILRYFVLLLWVSLFSISVSHAETLFVTDRILLGIHTEASEESPLLDSVPSGTAVQVLETAEAFKKVRLPNGKTFEPFQVTGIPAKVMDDLDTYKIKQFQIIQNKIDEIEIHIIIDEKLRNVGPSVEKILKEMEKRFKKAIGSSVNVIVKEVKEIEKDVRSDHVKVVVSKLKDK